MFAAYAPGTALALGVGGRYDKVFRSLSGDCSAVGFSLGLDLLLELAAAETRDMITFGLPKGGTWGLPALPSRPRD